MGELLATGVRTFFGVPAVPDLAGLDAQMAFLGVELRGSKSSDASDPTPSLLTTERWLTASQELGPGLRVSCS